MLDFMVNAKYIIQGTLIIYSPFSQTIISILVAETANYMRTFFYEIPCHKYINL